MQALISALMLFALVTAITAPSLVLGWLTDSTVATAVALSSTWVTVLLVGYIRYEFLRGE